MPFVIEDLSQNMKSVNVSAISDTVTRYPPHSPTKRFVHRMAQGPSDVELRQAQVSALRTVICWVRWQAAGPQAATRGPQPPHLLTQAVCRHRRVTKGYIDLVPVVTDLQVPVDSQLVDVRDDGHIRYARLRTGP